MPKAKIKGSVTDKDSALKWDKVLLLGFIAALSTLFIVLNREANGFFPDARLYPYVVTILGMVLAVLSVVRVMLGKEPNMDAQTGKDWNLSAEHTREAYRKTVVYLLMFCCFYLGIWLLGFRLASGLFVFGFIRSFGHSYASSAVYVFCGIILTEVLSRVLHMTLPVGLLLDFVFS